MVEKPIVPTNGGVAQAALGAQSAIMGVLFLMAGHAFCWREGKILAFMTIITLCLLMLGQEGEISKIMVKLRVFVPRNLIVTGSAVFALAALMGIILPVAINAGHARQSHRDRLYVAIGTYKLPVCAS